MADPSSKPALKFDKRYKFGEYEMYWLGNCEDVICASVLVYVCIIHVVFDVYALCLCVQLYCLVFLPFIAAYFSSFIYVSMSHVALSIEYSLVVPTSGELYKHPSTRGHRNVCCHLLLR